MTFRTIAAAFRRGVAALQAFPMAAVSVPTYGAMKLAAEAHLKAR